MPPKEYQKLYRLFSRSEKLKILALILMMLLAAVMEVVGIGMVPAFVALVADPRRVMAHERFGSWFERLGLEASRELLIFGAIALVAVFLLKNAYVLFFRYVEARFIYARLYALSHRLMRAYMRAPYTFYLQRNTSELLRNATEEAHRLINQVVSPLLKLVKDGILALAVIAFLLIVEPLITLFVALFIGGGAAVFLLVTQQRIKAYGKRAQFCRKEMIKTAREAFGGIKDARVMNREATFVEAFRSVAYVSSRMQQHKAFISEVPKPVVETIAVVGIMAIALVMYLQGRPIATIVPILALFGVAMVRLLPTVQQITRTLTQVSYSLVSVNPIYDDLEALEANGRAFDVDRRRGDRITLERSIEIRDLHYHYPGSAEPALAGVTLDIPKGRAIAFVGPSGAGKTTIVDLLLGLLEPRQGELRVDGRNIFDSISAWQRNIGYIPQFIYLSDDSLRRNIAFGVPDDRIDDAKLMRAATLAQLDDMVARLPDGLDTVIGERGARLSGGQRQRIGIARALYHDPQVLVMDEATSALDTITEQQIMRAIERLKGDRTIVIIAHRLTTVMNCDVLYLMDKGEIVAQGTYAELLAQNRQFREMAMEDGKESGSSDGPSPAAEASPRAP